MGFKLMLFAYREEKFQILYFIKKNFGHVTCGTDQIHRVRSEAHRKAFVERSEHEPLTF